MSSGPRLVNGEKEKVRGYEHGYGNRKEKESGAAGGSLSTDSSIATSTPDPEPDSSSVINSDSSLPDASGGSLYPSPPAASPSSSPYLSGCGVTSASRASISSVSVASATSGTGISGVTVGTAAGAAVTSALSNADGPEAVDSLASGNVVVVVSGLACTTGESFGSGIDEQFLHAVGFEESTVRRAEESAGIKRLIGGVGGCGGGSGGGAGSGVGVCSNDDDNDDNDDDNDDDDDDDDDDTSQGIETTEFGGTECTGSGSLENSAEAERRPHASSSYPDNMVAAMNEHLSTSSATSGARSGTASASTATAGNTLGNAGNSCSRPDFQNVQDDGKPAAAGILSFPCDFDHMYASMTDGGAPAAATATSALGVSPLRGNEPRQNDLTEVKHLKELLLLHLDLIQQQSEQIVTKDKLLAALRQENETLKLRLERIDRRVNLQKLRSESSENSITSELIGACSPPNINSTNTPSTSEVHTRIQPENNNSQFNESFKIRLNTSGGITTVKQDTNDNQIKQEVKLETSSDSRIEWEEKKKRKSDSTPLSSGSKRKRGVSCSSNVSNDASSALQDKTHESNKKGDKKGKLLSKKESCLTTKEHYYTAVGDPSYTLNLKEPNPVESGTSLEVPNWRVKIYTSCYTMEGTENLDDEIFNKRHLKLENDERRRKRWDVQRIREQRHIEKLKQRQERQNHQATCYNTNHTGPCPSAVEEEAVLSLWPDVDQIQSLQVDPQLPVTAFGAPIPNFTPSDFALPWSNTPRSTSRRPKRATGRRKTARR